MQSDGRQERQPFAPPEGSIERGRVIRIEPYGAFVQLDRFRARGLVHISQLASFKVEKVEDAVSLEDVVWVKVLEVNVDTDEATGKQRHKVRLSMRSAAQDGSGQDLDEENQQADLTKKRLEQSLNSSIGMGVALDPMAGLGSGGGSNLVLKNKQSTATIIQGYALVDDTEGEPENAIIGDAPALPPRETIKPLGRGRGTTLPAWMTQSDGPVGGDTDRKGQRDDDDSSRSGFSSSEDSHSRRKKRKHKEKKRKRDRSDRSRRHSKHSSRKHHRRRDDRKRRRRSRSRSFDSELSGSNRSDGGDVGFRSVEEAKKLIADLEEKKRKR